MWRISILVVLVALPVLAFGAAIGGVSGGGGGALAPTTMSGSAVTCASGAGTSTLSLDLSCPGTNGWVVAPIVNSDVDGCTITVAETSAAAGCQAIIYLVSTAGGTVTMADVSNVLDVDGSWTPVAGDNILLGYEDLANDRWQEAGRNKSWNAANDGSGSGLDADLLDGISSAGFYPIDAITTYSASSGVVMNATGLSTFDVQIDGDTRTGLVCTDAANDRVGLGTCAPSFNVEISKDGNSSNYVEVSNSTNGVSAAAGVYATNASNGVLFGFWPSSNNFVTNMNDVGFVLADSQTLNGLFLGQRYNGTGTSPPVRIGTSDGVLRDFIHIVETEDSPLAGTMTFNFNSENFDTLILHDDTSQAFFADASAGTVDINGGSASTGCSISAAGALTCTAATASLFVGSGSSTSAVDLATAEVAGTLPIANVATTTVCMNAGGSLCTITQNTHTYASSIAIDFAAMSSDVVTLTGDLTITTSNLAAGRNYQLIIIGDGSSRTLTLPSWKFVGAAAPTTIAANKTGILSLHAVSTTDASVVAAWAVQP